MAHKLVYPAVKITQPGLKENQAIYATSFSVRDLIDLSMFKVDLRKRDLIGKATQGYQRVINERHAQKIASFVAQEGSVLPTAVLVSSRDYIPEFKDGKLIINKFPLFIVDGQHRVAGLRIAIDNNELADWEAGTLPVVVLSGFDKFEEMIDFVDLNTKQKKVETDLALQLMYDMARGDARLKAKYVSEGTDWKVRAIKIVNELNQATDSPWHNSIKIAGEKSKSGAYITSSNSFATSLKPLVKGAFDAHRDVGINVQILSVFWFALRSVLTDAFLEPKEYAIQKTPGLFTLHPLLQAILVRKGHSFGMKKNEMKDLLGQILTEAEAPVDFWRSDNTSGVTMYGSMKGFRLLSEKFIEALNEVDH